MKRSRGLHWVAVIVVVIGVQLQTPQVRAQEAKLTYSSDKTDKTPAKGVEFRGPFTNQVLAVKCEQLGAHDFIEVSFDLLILVSWDGAIPVPANTQRPPALGPDYMRVALENGPTLVYATFGNVPMNSGNFRPESKAQTYPSQIPGRFFPTQAGASEFNTLGYDYPGQPIPMDATYAIRFVIPHHDPNVTLEIGGQNLQAITDENWGMTNLHVRPLRADQVKKPGKDEIANAFLTSFINQPGDLADAFRTLIMGMDDTTAWIDANVTPGDVDSKQINDLIKKLTEGSLEERAQASNALRAIGHQVEPYLRDARKAVKPDQREQIDWILEALGVTPVGDESIERVILSERILEVIGTPKAVALRKKLMDQQ